MNPYKFIGLIIYCIVDTVVCMAVSIIAIIVLGAIFLFDKTVRSGRHKEWFKWN